MKTIYIITWKSGVGKWALCQYLAKRDNCVIFKPSSLTARILQEFNIPETRENFSKMMHTLRANFSQDIYVFAAYEFIENCTDNQIIIDGIRKIHFIKKLQEMYDCKVIFIDSTDSNRWQRIKDRWEKHNESSMSFDQFLIEDWLASEQEIEEIRSIADSMIENNWNKEEFYKKLDSIFPNI
jgi:dephospho-CoA kinase